jgi:ketosteroid isomerase-like protein
MTEHQLPPEHDEHPNVALVRELYTLLATGDVSGYLALIADDAIFHVGGDSIVAGEYAGKEAIVELGLKAIEETGGTFRTELLAALASDSHAATLHRWTAQRRGRSIEMQNFNVYRFDHGKVVERWEFIEDQDAHDTFWAP